MKIISMISLGLASFALALPANASSFFCSRGSNTPRPAWVSEPDTYKVAGHWVAVGFASSSGKSLDEQHAAAEADADQHLVQRLGVEVTASNERRIQQSQSGVQQSGSTEVTVAAKAFLRGRTFKEHWIDPDSCEDFVLALVSEESAARSQREKLAQENFIQFKQKLSAGQDENRYPVLEQRRVYLDEAQALFSALDFNLLPQQAAQQTLFAQQLRDAQSALKIQISAVQGRVALVVLNQNNGQTADMLTAMLDSLKSGGQNRDFLAGNCHDETNCIALAKERGFSRLILLKVNTEVALTAFGMTKGVVHVEQIEHDLNTHKRLSSAQAVSQVLGLSPSALDWLSVVEKTMDQLRTGR